MPLPLGPFPYTLTNGTLADANQVMADFNLLLNGINGLAPLAQVTAGGVSNVAANLATAGTSVTVTADTVTVATALNGTSYTLTSYSQSFNGATTGPGGMDTGAPPTSGFVALYAIYNPTAPAISILGKNANVSAPTIYNGVNMPAGYTASALLGVWPTATSPNLRPGYIRGKQFQLQGAIGVLSGSTTNQPSMTSLSVALVAPPNAISCGGYASIITGGAFAGGGVSLYLASDASGNVYQAVGGYVASGVATGVNGSFTNLLLATPQVIYYSTGNVSANATANIGLSSYMIP